MLLKTNDELKANFSGIDKDYKFLSLKSFVDDAEKDILIPWIGQEIYDVIDAAYNAGTIAGKQLTLLSYLQKASVHLALMLSADSGSFRISDSGFYVVVTDTNKPVSDKKMSEFKKGRRESGYRAMEQAIIYLEKNISDEAFATYADSDQHLQHSAYFINDSVLFTRYYNKVSNSAYLFSKMLDAVDFCERTNIAPTLGLDYYLALKDRIAENSTSAAEKLLLPYIYRALVNYTIAKAIPGLSLEFDGSALVVRTQPTTGNFDVAEQIGSATAAQLSSLVGDAAATGLAELRNLEDYLIANAGSLDGYIPPAEDGDDFDINEPCRPTFFV